MSETEKSGPPTTASADLPASAPGAFGSFAASRGSGLARGKRPSTAAAAPSAPAVPDGYKPSSVAVITSQSEYKNPFTGETSVTAPRANEPAPPAVPLPSVSAVKEESAQAPVNSPIPESSASLDAVAQSDLPETTEPEIKPELKILPPEGPRRASVRWEATAPAEAPAPASESTPPRAEERRTFQPSRERREGREPREGGREGREGREPREAREARPAEPRPPRESREQREPRRDDRRSEPRPHQPQPERRPLPEPEKKSGGFMGWLKGIFGGGKPAESEAKGDAATEPRREGDQGQGHGGHRGGRGRGGQGGQGGEGGFRGESRGPQGEPREGGDDRGEGDQNGRRRRRRRGGRGRSRGEGGDRGARPEGQQGGGAI